MHDLNSMKPPLRKSHVGRLMSFSHGHGSIYLTYRYPGARSRRLAAAEPSAVSDVAAAPAGK